MGRYSSFGLTIDSDIPCGLPVMSFLSPDITIQQAEVPFICPEGLQQISPFAGYGERKWLWQAIPDLIRTQGTPEQISWQAEKPVSHLFVLEFLLHLALPFALLCRGYYVRTGVAVHLKDHSVIMPSLGLPTSARLTAELVEAGVLYFSEGLCAARQTSQGNFEVLPGVPRIRSIKKERHSRDAELKTVREGFSLSLFEPLDSFCERPQPLTDIISIASQQTNQTKLIKSVSGMERLEVLRLGDYLPANLVGTQTRKNLWSMLISMAESVNMSKLMVSEQNKNTLLSNALLEVF